MVCLHINKRKGALRVAKRVRQLIFAVGMLLLLAGCAQPGEDFYALPQLPDDYLALQQTINQVMSELGAEYAAPSSGSNTQNIQLHDLDGDDKGVQEAAVAFFRVPSAEKPLKIYIFQQDVLTGEYKAIWSIEGDGTAIYSVAFENLGGTKAKELVVSWQISSKVHSLAAYSLEWGGEVVELMRSGYTKQSVVDLDRDNEKEIVLVQLDTAENNSRAELYQYDNGLMVHKSAAPLSLGLTEVKSAKVGTLEGTIPALFVSSNFGDVGGRVTDIIALRDGVLTNLTLDEETGMSTATRRYYKDFQDEYGYDINSDGILELPVPEALPMVGESTTQLYLLHWYQFDLDGAANRVCTTFHSYDDGWYLILPEKWQGKVSVARKESNASNASSERAVSFYYATDWSSEREPVEFLTIYRLTGTNRAYRATIDDRFVLVESSDVVYAAKFRDVAWNCGLNHDTLLEQFNRIKVSWSAEN